MKIRLSAFADEASADLAEQIGVLREERIPYIELRGLDGKNVSDLTEEEAKRYKEMLDEGGVAVWSVGSPLGKIGVGDDFEAHLQKAAHTFRLANIFGTEKVRVFSFYTEDPRADEAEVFSRMRRMAELAAEYGVTLYHENEKEIYGDMAERCARLLDAVPALGCVFDPANFVQCGQDVSSALALLEQRVDYYHIKDALADGTVVPAGEGEGCVSRMIAGIGKDTVLTVEPHLAVFEGYANIDRTQLKNKYVYASPREAFAAAAAALRAVLKENGYREENGTWVK